jgi:hypothetical protein
VAVIVEVANDRRDAADVAQARNNFRHSRRSLRHIHRDPHQLRTSLGKLLALRESGRNVRSIRIGHRLDDYWRAAAYLNVANLNAIRLPPRNGKDLHSPFIVT